MISGLFKTHSSLSVEPSTSANVATLCLVPGSAGAGPQLTLRALGLCKLLHVHMLRMVQVSTPIFHHLPILCIYTQRPGRRWIATTSLQLVRAETFKMLTCSPQERRVVTHGLCVCVCVYKRCSEKVRVFTSVVSFSGLILPGSPSVRFFHPLFFLPRFLAPFHLSTSSPAYPLSPCLPSC